MEQGDDMAENEVKESGNGANLIVLDSEKKILVVRELTRKRLMMLPGGEIERGESPRHAAQEETEEETGLITDGADFRLIGFLFKGQRGWSSSTRRANSPENS